jgi:hypothetical protein
VEADVTEFIATLSMHEDAIELHKAVGDMSLIAFYYLVRIGEYTTKDKCPESKQTVKFKMEDVTFFGHNNRGELRVIPRDTPNNIIAMAHSATLKLDNQKNGWKGVCVHQESNGNPFFCPVRALGRQYLHLRKNNGSAKTTLSTYFQEGIEYKMMAENMTRALKVAALALNYPTVKGIPIACIDTHSL